MTEPLCWGPDGFLQDSSPGFPMKGYSTWDVPRESAALSPVVMILLTLTSEARGQDRRAGARSTGGGLRAMHASVHKPLSGK